MVDTPRLQLSLPAQMRDENYKLVINSMSVNNGISLKDLSHYERPRNIILKVQSFGATNYLGFCVALLPSGMMAGVWEHVSGWHRVGFPILIRSFKDLLYFIVVDLGVDPFCFIFYIAVLSRWCCRKKHQWSSYGGCVKYPHSKQEKQLLPNEENLNSRQWI